MSAGETRETAARLAKWLVDKGRPDEAVALLSAWAANGPNNSSGQQLLAEALRIDPSARVAQMAFERMEGMSGDHDDLDAAIAAYPTAELEKLEAEMKRPTFRKAQMGFNNNIKWNGQVFHVQTEDSGLDQPHILTQLCADGGRVIKSHRRSYEEHVKRDDVAEFVRNLMKGQHFEMVLALREGRFNAILEGKEVGGLVELSEPPNVDILKLQSKKKKKAEAAAASAAASEKKAPEQQVHFQLKVLRSLTGGPESYAPEGDLAIVGSKGAISLDGEVFCHPEEAMLSVRGEGVWLEDLDGGNGVFLRIRTPVELDIGDEFVVGDQLLRVEKNPVADDAPDPDPTYFYSSPKWPSSFRVVQVFAGGAVGACVVARGNTLQVGSAVGDLVFPDDPLVAEQHCIVEEQAGAVVLTDLGSRTGVFVRIRGEQQLSQGDELLVGRTRLVVKLKTGQAA
jgi:hypothetical protein